MTERGSRAVAPTVAAHGSGQRRARRSTVSSFGSTARPLSGLSALTAGVLLLALVIVACGSSATASPRTSASPDGSAGPKPSRWPGTAVLAIIKLGGIDGEIAKAGRDFITAADARDVEAMWGAADGLIPVVSDLTLSVQHLAEWDKTTELAGYLETAYPLMLEGATQLRDSITAGDSAGVEEGSRKLAEGLTAYSPARAILADLVPEALLQQRVLNL